jgi:hypothetical protein
LGIGLLACEMIGAEVCGCAEVDIVRDRGGSCTPTEERGCLLEHCAIGGAGPVGLRKDRNLAVHYLLYLIGIQHAAEDVDFVK